MLTLAVLGSVPALAYVEAVPGFYNFGSVTQGSIATEIITFQNFGSENYRFFNVTCNGDFESFNCNSSCFSLPPHSSCSVNVEFTPRNGDNQIKTATVQGQGDGAFASAQVEGEDAKPFSP